MCQFWLNWIFFSKIYPFYLICQIYWHNSVQNISLVCFKVYRVCSDIHAFITGYWYSVISFSFSLYVQLGLHQFCWAFQRIAFGFVIFLYFCLFSISLISALTFIISFFLLCIYFSFFQLLKMKHEVTESRPFFFSNTRPFKDINFLQSTASAIFYQCWSVLFLLTFTMKFFKILPFWNKFRENL